jgi:hypothetical protein
MGLDKAWCHGCTLPHHLSWDSILLAAVGASGELKVKLLPAILEQGTCEEGRFGARA